MDDKDLSTLWDEVVQAIKTEIPRAQFETWLQGTRVVGVANGKLTIMARNAYARDWLESRIWVRARQLLGETVSDLRFVVADDNDVVADDAGTEGDEGAAVETDETDDEPEEAGAAEIEVSAEEYASLYEQAVRPERAVYLPGYFRRWLPLLGPELAWFYVGFRQAAYWSSHGRRSGQYSGRFSGRQVAALCGVTERTFWNRSRREETWQKLAGLIRKDGQRYTVAMSLPLTGPDARALASWLATHIEVYGGVEGVLEAACQTPVEELLLAGQEQTDFPAMPILQLLQETFPDLPERTLKAAAEKLRLHLMPQSDQIVISLFFLENVLPWLKAGPAWVYVLLRDRCYVDKAGSGRDTVAVHGGYQEIADWLGISRARTVYDWLRDPIARIYLASSVEERKGTGWENNPLIARILLNDVPVEIAQAAVLQKRPVFDANFSLGLLSFDAIFSDSCRDFQSPVTQFSVSFDANFSGALTRISEFFDAIFSALKPLTESESLKKPFKTDQPAVVAKANEARIVEPVGRPSEAGRDSEAEWDFEGILERLETNPRSRLRLRESGVPAETFVAWLLQALTMPKVDPVRIAIAWSLDARQRQRVEETFRILASSPRELRREAREVAAGRKYRGMDERIFDAVAQAYRQAYGESQVVARQLLFWLFGERWVSPAE